MVLFSRVVLNETGPWRSERKWVKNQLSIKILVCKNQNFLKNLQRLIGFFQNEQKFAARILTSFEINKDFFFIKLNLIIIKFISFK